MKAIVAVDKNWGIGYKGKLLERIPDDMKFFRNMTLNKVIVMGRATFESFPDKKPLKNRVNVVLSSTAKYQDKDIVLCRSKQEAMEFLEPYSGDDIFIIGGEAVYREFLPYCDEVYITKIDKEHVADRFFPNLDSEKDWELVKSSESSLYNDIKYKVCLYKYINGRNV